MTLILFTINVLSQCYTVTKDWSFVLNYLFKKILSVILKYSQYGTNKKSEVISPYPLLNSSKHAWTTSTLDFVLFFIKVTTEKSPMRKAQGLLLLFIFPTSVINRIDLMVTLNHKAAPTNTPDICLARARKGLHQKPKWTSSWWMRWTQNHHLHITFGLFSSLQTKFQHFQISRTFLPFLCV